MQHLIHEKKADTHISHLLLVNGRFVFPFYWIFKEIDFIDVIF